MNGTGMPEKSLQPILPFPSARTTPPAEFPRAKRARASKSCDHCRKRKTRCDVEISMPCSNCRTSGRECRISQEPKKRGPASQRYVHELENRLNKMEALLEKYTRHSNSTKSGYSAFACPNKDSAGSEELSQQLNALTLANYERTKYIGNSAGIHLLDDDVFQHKRRLRLEASPSWILQKVNDDDEEHIIIRSEELVESKQATDYDRCTLFEIFPQMTLELADYLIEIYFRYIHPYNCAINKIAFLEQYYYANPHPPDHYLLYAMFASAIRLVPISGFHLPGGTFVGEQDISALRHSLRAESQRAVELAHKRSRISTVQTLIILTMFMDMSDNNEEDTMHWFVTGAAIRMAQDLGLHRNSSRWAIPKHEIELRRRIWYSVYLLDKWVAADLGRPPSISDDDFDVELPSLTEIESPYSTLDGANVPTILLQAREDVATQRPIYTVFRAGVTAVQILDKILRGFYSVKKQSTGAPDLALATRLENELQQWKNNLPPCLQYDVYSNEAHLPFAAILYASYNCMLLLIHRPFIIHKEKSKTVDVNVALRALEISSKASNNFVDCIEELATSLPPGMFMTTMIYSSLQASAIFIFNAKSDNPFHREQGIRNLTRLANVFRAEAKSLHVRRISRILDSLVAKFTAPAQNTASNTSIHQQLLSEHSNVISYPSANEAQIFNNFETIQFPSIPQIRESEAIDTLNPCSGLYPFELTNLSSDVPLWNVPNGLTWSDWESFLQSSMDQSHC